MKKAFTMIELIFVIVVLGILASVALPKFASTKRNADIASGKADIASIRAAIINERQTQLVRGRNDYIPILSKDNVTLFTGTGTVPGDADDHNRTLMLYGISVGSAEDGWTVDNTFTIYKYGVTGTQTTFTYYPDDITVGGVFHSGGTFNCTAGQHDCDALVK